MTVAIAAPSTPRPEEATRIERAEEERRRDTLDALMASQLHETHRFARC